LSNIQSKLKTSKPAVHTVPQLFSSHWFSDTWTSASITDNSQHLLHPMHLLEREQHHKLTGPLVSEATTTNFLMAHQSSKTKKTSSW